MRQSRQPWRSSTVLALVLVGLALLQACGKSGSSTGPTTGSALQLKLRRASGALLPPGCGGGQFSISAPGQKPITGPLQNGQIVVSLTVGVTYLVEVTGIQCPGIPGPISGSATFFVPPGGFSGEIEITVSQIFGVTCSPSSIPPGETSQCTCNAQSLGGTITWTGAQGSGPTATFSSNTPGTHSISCTIPGIATQTTTVTVEQPEPPPPPPPPPPPTTGTIVIQNGDEEADLRATFSGGVSQLIVNPGGSGSRTVAPGTYDVTIHFNFDGFLFCTTDTITVQAGQTVTRSYDGGDCLLQQRRR